MLADLRPKLVDQAIKAEKQEVEIKKNKEEALVKEQEHTIDQASVIQQSQEIQMKESVAKEKYENMEPFVREAKDAVKDLAKKDIDEVRNYSAP